MKLGADLRTGQTWNLTSWFTNDSPDLGAFTLSWEPNGESSQRLTIRQRGNPYWTNGDSSFIWSPEFCYGYETDTGCVESSNLPRCRSDDDMFRQLNGDFIRGMSSISVDDNASLILSDCMVRCWNDCSCLGFTKGSSNGTGCITWTGNKSVNNFTINVQGTSISKYVLISPTTSKESWPAALYRPPG
nr:G-type lectin S-receptor-like serine/threonine-protein kinase CES101 [Tanacetum cinerariifolium]